MIHIVEWNCIYDKDRLGSGRACPGCGRLLGAQAVLEGPESGFAFMKLRQSKRGRTIPESVVIRDTEGERNLRRRGEDLARWRERCEMSLRIVFMGTPDFAVPTLIEIVGRGHEVVAVYTRAAQARRATRARPHAEPGRARGAPLRACPCSRRRPCAAPDAEGIARGHGADVAVIVAYGLILPKPILEAWPLGAFNLHASLLPRWRGAAPINRAIMAGDAETGVMVMKMEEGLDTGPVAMAERVPIPSDATAGDLHDRLARLGADLMVRALGAIERGSLTLTPQPEAGVTYASKIGKDETRISLGAAVAGGARPHPRLVAVSRRVVRDRGGGRPHQGAAHDQRRGCRRARHRAGRPAYGGLRGWRGAYPRIAARRPSGDEGRRVPARYHALPPGPGSVKSRHAPLQAHDRVRRQAVRRLADPGQRPLGARRAGGRGRSVLRGEGERARRRAHRRRRACARPGRSPRSRQGRGRTTRCATP